MMLLQRPNGTERVLAASMAGHEGWTVIAQNVPAPGPFQKWDDATAAWVEDTAARDAHDRLQLARDPKALLDLIDELRRQINGGGE